MTDQPADLPAWGGVYRFDRAAVEAPGGRDQAAMVSEGRIRATARENGHEPVGRVHLEWSDTDPGAGSALAPQDPDPEHVWAQVAVLVRPGAAAKARALDAVDWDNAILLPEGEPE